MRTVSETSGTTLKHQHSHYRGPRRRREKGPEKIFEDIIAENFPNMRKETLTQVQEMQRVPYRMNPRRNIPRHILTKLTKIKDKEKTLKATREKKYITYQGIPIGLSLIFRKKLCRPQGSGTIYFK